TVSKACDSQVSSGLSAALMPPAAATECERTGWTLLMIATVAPASAAASAARCPANPAPMIRTSWDGIGANPTRRGAGSASRRHGDRAAHLLGRDHPAQEVLAVDREDRAGGGEGR